MEPEKDRKETVQDAPQNPQQDAKAAPEGDLSVALRHERARRKEIERELSGLRERLAEKMDVPPPEPQKSLLEDKDADEFIDIATAKDLLAEQRRLILAELKGEQERAGKVDALVNSIGQYEIFSRQDEAGEIARLAVERAILAAPEGADFDSIIAETARKTEAAIVGQAVAEPTQKRPSPTPDPTPGAAEAASMRTPKEHPDGVRMADLAKEARARIGSIRERVAARMRASGV